VKLPFKNITIKFSSPWLIALIPFFVTLIFIPEYFNKYNLKLISQQDTGNTISYCHDLNHDGNSEYLRFSTYQKAQILVQNFEQKLEEVYNLPGKWYQTRMESPVFFIGDCNNDNFDEIFALTVNENDSLYISLIKHYPGRKLLKNKFVVQLTQTEGVYDYSFQPLGLEDNNGDGKPEFLFAINAGFPLQPRAVYAWDVVKDSIYRSPLSGVAIKSFPGTVYFKDMDNDGIKELFIRTVATDNYKDSFPYSDNDSWVMVFTKNLEFLFEPVKISGAQTSLSHFPISLNESLVTGVNIFDERNSDIHPTFQFYNNNGRLIKETFLPDISKKSNHFLYSSNSQIYLVNFTTGIMEMRIINPISNHISKTAKFPAISYFNFFIDLDNDGTNEIILWSDLYKKLVVARSNFKYFNNLSLSHTKSMGEFSLSVAYQNSKPAHALVVARGVTHIIRYSRNPFYYLNFALAALYYLFLVLAFRQLRKSWLLNLQRKQQAEQEMQKLQMQTVLNQLNPHFTFNAINTVGADILNNEPQKAYDSLTRLSRLLRKSVDHAFVPYKTLGEEIDFLREYLEVEKSRFGDKLEYEITIQNDIDLQLKVPKMLIQLFVENAIKHGLFHKPEGGKVVVDIRQQPEVIKIIVQDNGVGRQKAAELSDGRKGKGMLILRNYLRLFKEQFNREITFEIQDIIGDGEVCGTRVEILIHS
jgi:sensor histidine kinase YesM